MRAGHNVTTDGAPRAGSTELAGRIWPAGRTLPTPALTQTVMNKPNFFIPQQICCGKNEKIFSAGPGLTPEK